MPHELVVTVKDPYDIYIGRVSAAPDYCFGNPFGFNVTRKGLYSIKVTNRQEAVARYESWLRGETDTDLEQGRRAWILKNLTNLRGKRLACFCAPELCHGEVLIKLLEETDNV